jgi:hypothetical protein
MPAPVDAAAPDAGVPVPDAGPDAYVKSGPGPFGLEARPSGQTCKPPAQSNRPAERLSATGCVDPADPKKPAATLIPYDVLAPLWSDGADKQRFLALPDGQLIHVKDCMREPERCKPKREGGTTDDDGHWQLPVGTVLVKTFSFGGKPLETRLFVRLAQPGDRWVGYSYQWDEAATDATIVPEIGAVRPIVGAAGKMQTWSFPGRNDCLECHNKVVGFSLGLETRQLDRPLAYPSGVTASQLDTLEHIGVLDGPVRRLPPLSDFRPGAAPAASLDERARSYLHANCGICHRPEGNYADIDLRYGVPLGELNICNVDPNKGNVGVVGSKRLVPGAPERSVTLLRMQAPDQESGRMPELATSVLDPVGIPLVSDWIKSITACP